MSDADPLKPFVVTPAGGREYPMGRMSAVFKADLAETANILSASEWWLEPNTKGPPPHQHPETHLFYVLQGELVFYLEGRGWFEAGQGSYLFIPGNTQHGFENRSATRAGFLSINTPGGFEKSLPHIVGYFDEHPLGDAV